MATITVRDSGWFQARIRRRGYPVQSKSFRTKTAAETWARGIETEMDRGAFMSSTLAERTTFSEVIRRFTSEYAPYHYRSRDDRKEAWRFQCQHLEKALGPYSLSAITPKLVAKYRDERLLTVSGSTVRKELNLLSKVLTVASQEFELTVVAKNPVSLVRKPKEGKGRNRRLTEEEWTSLEHQCRASRNPWLWPGVRFAVETGMRQGELLQLHWEMIDWDRHLALLLDPDKIKNSEPRAVPLSLAAIDVLKGLPVSVRKGVIFPLERMTLYHVFIAACKRANISDYTWHDLRHEGMSRLAERGNLSLLEMASVSGHKTLQMLKRYIHLQAKNIAKKLDEPVSTSHHRTEQETGVESSP